MARSIVAERDGVVVGVDTHADNPRGGCPVEPRRTVVATTPAGFGELVGGAMGFGPVRCFGVEGTGSYGAALARHLRAVGHTVVEVDRPDRRTRRLQGKSDPVDAEAAARAVLAGTASGCPKAGDGRVEMIRSLRVARRSALKRGPRRPTSSWRWCSRRRRDFVDRSAVCPCPPWSGWPPGSGPGLWSIPRPRRSSPFGISLVGTPR